jgi:hypothetical protein
MKKGTEVIITSEAVGDQNLPSNKAKVVRTFTQPAYGTNPDGSKVPDYELVEVEFENSDVSSVGLHEVRPKDMKYYQPKFGPKGEPPFYEGVELYSFEVYKSKAECEKDFPNHEILEFSGDDIEDPTFVD